eukprot:1159268-Pelagomonas_calceolata.AAC.9
MHRARSLSLSPDFANKTRMHRNCSTRADAWKGDNTIVLGHLQGLGAYRGRHAMTADDRCGEEFESQSPGWESGVSRRGNQSSGGSCSSLSRGSCKVFYDTPTLVHLQQQPPGLGHTIWDLQFLGGGTLGAGGGVEGHGDLRGNTSAEGKGCGGQWENDEPSKECKQLSLAVLMHRTLQCPLRRPQCTSH